MSTMTRPEIDEFLREATAPVEQSVSMRNLLDAVRPRFAGRVDTEDAIERWAPAPTGINEAFLREVMAYIELHPERWDQQYWASAGACGTSYCLAGWAYVLGTGQEFHIFDMSVTPTELVVEAGKLLGLSVSQAVALFNFALVTGYDDQGYYFSRHPSFEEFCEKVERVTGITFKPALAVA